MDSESLKLRTKQFALRNIRLVGSISGGTVNNVLKSQLVRSATSVAANYREACRSRSNAEFVAKLGIVEQELDESLLWIELLVESGIVPESKLADLMKEADELLRIVVSSIRTARINKK